MKNRVRWDEDNGCVRFELHGPVPLADAEMLIEGLEQHLQGKPRRLLLVDHTDSPEGLPSETRAYFKRRTGELGLERLAFFGVSNVVRIATRVIIAITRPSAHVKFFATEAEAISWLQERS